MTDESGNTIYIDEAKTIKSQQLNITGNGAMKNYTNEINTFFDQNDITKSAYIRTKAPWGAYNNQITQINIEEGITDLGNNSFVGLDKVTQAKLPDTLEVIGASAFYLCKNLTQINIPSSLTAIQYAGFYATNLENIVVPSTVSYIGEVAFGGNGNLEAVIIEGTPSLDTNVFSGIGDVADERTWELINTHPVKIYCPSNLDCNNKGQSANGTIISYQSSNDTGQFIIEGKFYNSLSDLLKGKSMPKRIYTIDEASKVAGKKNRFSIKYR